MTPRTEPQTTSSKGRVGPDRFQIDRRRRWMISEYIPDAGDGCPATKFRDPTSEEWEAAALSPEPLTVERAIDAMKVSAADGHTPASDWISVGVVKAIIRGDHPILGRLSEPPKP